MPEMRQVTTPVALIIFNRPDTTAKVFAEIRRARPLNLLVVADGPRIGRPDDKERCLAARAVVEQIDWPCEVVKNYSDINLGCRSRVSTGINWVFEKEEEAIILEDDCVPHPAFFRFCEELLARYRHDDRIAHIGGTNYQFGRRRTPHSYYFSRYNHIWGWASWRRAWKDYDVDMKIWPEVRDGNWLQDVLTEKRLVRYWQKNFDKVFAREIDTWDFQWTLACWVNSRLSILPAVNMISNIGCNADATHTLDSNSRVANMQVEGAVFPLSHPPIMVRDRQADCFTEQSLVRHPLAAAVQQRLWQLFGR